MDSNHSQQNYFLWKYLQNRRLSLTVRCERSDCHRLALAL